MPEESEGRLPSDHPSLSAHHFLCLQCTWWRAILKILQRWWYRSFLSSLHPKDTKNTATHGEISFKRNPEPAKQLLHIGWTKTKKPTSKWAGKSESSLSTSPTPSMATYNHEGTQLLASFWREKGLDSTPTAKIFKTLTWETGPKVPNSES